MKSKVEPSLSDVSPLTRRMFISAATATAAALGGERDAAHGTPPGQATLSARSRAAYDVRVDAARAEKDAAQPDQVSNGDEQQFANRIGNFSKGMPHNALGEVDPNAYSIFVQALTNGGQQSALDQVPMGSLDPSRQEKFVNPCSGVCFDLQGADSHHLTIPPAPGVSSAEAAGEMVELYWHASLAMCLSPNSIRAPPPRLLRPS